jgi:hypothetical protein
MQEDSAGSEIMHMASLVSTEWIRPLSWSTLAEQFAVYHSRAPLQIHGYFIRIDRVFRVTWPWQTYLYGLVSLELSSDCDDPGTPSRPGLTPQATDPAFELLSSA